MKFREYISYCLGVMTGHKFSALHYMELRHGDKIPGHNSETKPVRVVFFVRDTLSRYDLAICEVF